MYGIEKINFYLTLNYIFLLEISLLIFEYFKVNSYSVVPINESLLMKPYNNKTFLKFSFRQFPTTYPIKSGNIKLLEMFCYQSLN